jgi:hypothetical protein
MCYPHWMAVPRLLQREVWRTYRKGQERDQRPSAEYCAAAKAAVRAVAEREGRTVTGEEPELLLYDAYAPEAEPVEPQQRDYALGADGDSYVDWSYDARADRETKERAAVARREGDLSDGLEPVRSPQLPGESTTDRPSIVAYRVMARPSIGRSSREVLVCRDCKEHPDFPKWYDPDAAPEAMTREQIGAWFQDHEKPVGLDGFTLCDCCGEPIDTGLRAG